MIYHSVKKKQTPRFVYFGIAIFSLTVFVFSWTSIRTIIVPVVVPLANAYGVSKTGFGKMISAIDATLVSKKSLVKNNQELSLTVERLENDLALSQAKVRELEDMSTGTSSSAAPVLVMYPVVTDYSRLYSTVILSKGFKSGVTVGSLVYMRGRHLACTITEVYVNSSLCKLFSAYDETVEGVVGGVTVFVKGDGGSSFVADISKDDAIKEGDVVYLKSDPSYALGEVREIRRDEQAAFWKIYIRSYYNPLTSSSFYTSR